MSEIEVITCTLKLSPTMVSYMDKYTVKQIRKAIDQDILRRDTREWLARRIEDKREEYSEQEARLLGRHLYETIFRDEIKTVFEARVKTAREEIEGEKKKRLRLELIFGEGTADLARLPWEFLYPNNDDFAQGFLAGEVDITLTRFIGPPLAKIPDPVDRPVKILLAVCVEEDFDEIKELKGLLANAKESGDVEVAELKNPTFDELKAKVHGRDWEPDIVHIIGEGVPGAIVLQREASAIDSDINFARSEQIFKRQAMPVQQGNPVGEERLRELFQGHAPKLVILQTCYSDKVVDGEALYTAAQSIVGAGVPAVLAMQYDIERPVADKFASRLYEGLFKGDPIDVAVGDGRKRLRDRDSGGSSPYRAFGTPVIYLGHGRPLVKEPLQAPKSGSDKPPQESMTKRECPRCRAECPEEYCWSCGQRLIVICPKCKRELPNAMSRFCGKCGTPIPQRVDAGKDTFASTDAARAATISPRNAAPEPEPDNAPDPRAGTAALFQEDAAP
jgi:hypothetical protein